MLHWLTAVPALCLMLVALPASAADEGHCLAASPAGGCAAKDPRDASGALIAGVHVAFGRPTTRYAHAVLGDAVEWGSLSYTDTATGLRAEVVLPEDRVFEDLTPRLWDLDQDGMFEIVVIESAAASGAQLAVYALRDGELRKIAATPHIGRTFRWLAPLGAADLDGDGRIEIAYIDRPHLAKTLRVWRFDQGSLLEVAAARGLTNHKIGEAFISGGIRDCGEGPEIITADAAWRSIMATRLEGGALVAREIAPFRGPASFAPILACN